MDFYKLHKDGLLVVEGCGGNRGDEQQEQDGEGENQTVVLPAGETDALHQQSSRLRQSLLLRNVIPWLENL